MLRSYSYRHHRCLVSQRPVQGTTIPNILMSFIEPCYVQNLQSKEFKALMSNMVCDIEVGESKRGIVGPIDMQLALIAEGRVESKPFLSFQQ
jgi:hypothetical protein